MKDRRISDRYQIIRPIGGGGMADVYLAKDLILDRQVAVKTLKSQFSKDDEFIRRFRREAQSATSLSHPNVVNIFDVGEQDDLYYIVMEFIDGYTLKDFIVQKGALTPEEAVPILRQITAAISHAHENQLIHRDLKPHNILISNDGTAKVTDFGIARAISDATITHTNSVLGSVHYLSPEQARGGHITYKSDLYSVGIMTYEMLVGKPPFDGENAVSIALMHLQNDVPPVRESHPEIPQSFENFVIRATAKDPTKRFASAKEMTTDLLTILHTNRVNEAPLNLAVADDNEMTMAIPIIKDQDNLKEPKIASEETDTKPFNEKESSSKLVKEKNDPPDNKKKKATPLKKAIIAGAVILLLLIAAFFFLPSLWAENEVEVPSGLIGLEVDEARAQLEALGFNVEEETSYDDTMEIGFVIGHDPEAGETLEEGSTVTLFVSEGVEPTEMEDVIGVSRERALRVLSNYEDVEVIFEENTDYSEDTVLLQLPEAGEPIIPSETRVVLTVSVHPVFTMPNLSGMSREEVLEELEGNPLVNLVFEEEYHPVISEGYVIRQNPSRNTEIRSLQTVTIVFSNGPEPVEEVEENNEEEVEPEAEENEEENVQETAEAVIPFSIELGEVEEGETFTIELSVIDANNDTPAEFITEEISESKTYEVPFRVEPGESGYLLLTVNGNEYEDSPYEYTYEEVLSYMTDN